MCFWCMICANYTSLLIGIRKRIYALLDNCTIIKHMVNRFVSKLGLPTVLHLTFSHKTEFFIQKTHYSQMKIYSFLEYICLKNWTHLCFLSRFLWLHLFFSLNSTNKDRVRHNIDLNYPFLFSYDFD